MGSAWVRLKNKSVRGDQKKLDVRSTLDQERDMPSSTEQTRALRFRKRPIVVEAVQFTGTNCLEIIRFMGGPWENLELHNTDQPVINTLEGQLTASAGDWIIKGVNGEFYTCKPDIFAATYEPASTPPRSRAAEDLLDSAWGLIANAPFGDWSKQTKEWGVAVAKWRDEYYAWVASTGEENP